MYSTSIQNSTPSFSFLKGSKTGKVGCSPSTTATGARPPKKPSSSLAANNTKIHFFEPTLNDQDTYIQSGPDKLLVKSKKDGTEHTIRIYDSTNQKVATILKVPCQPVYRVYNQDKQCVATVTRAWSLFHRTYSIRLPNDQTMLGNTLILANGDDLSTQNYELCHKGKCVGRVSRNAESQYCCLEITSKTIDASTLLWCCITIEKTYPRGN